MVEIAIRVRSLDLESPRVTDVLVGVLQVGMVIPSDGYAIIPFFVREESAVEDTAAFVQKLRSELPEVEILGLEQDLVNRSDVANRVGVSREAARLWAQEKGFPLPVGAVGAKGEKIYDWADVAHWLTATGKDPEAAGELPTAEQRVQLASAVLRASKSPRAVSPSIRMRTMDLGPGSVDMFPDMTPASYETLPRFEGQASRAQKLDLTLVR